MTTEELTDNFGATLQRLRRAKKITQSELAQALKLQGQDIDVTYLSKLENSKTKIPPSEPLIRALARVLEVNPEHLLEIAGRYDQKELREVVADFPEAGVLLRRLQKRRIPRDQLRKWLNEIKPAED